MKKIIYKIILPLRILKNKIDYTWQYPTFFKYFLLTNQIFSRKRYLDHLPSRILFDDEKRILDTITSKSLSYFEGKKELPKFCKIYHSNKEIKFKSSKPAYRFIENPLIAVPEIIDFLKCRKIGEILSKCDDLKVVGLNLRISDGNNVEEKTTCFHRDFNGFQSIKLFLPLLKSKDPFLEYYPSSELLNPLIPFYSPKHKKFSKLKKKYKLMKTEKTCKNKYSATILNTSSIHRELPSESIKLTLIITFLPHLDYGKRGLRLNSDKYVYFQSVRKLGTKMHVIN